MQTLLAGIGLIAFAAATGWASEHPSQASKETELAVVGVLMDAGHDNMALAEVWASLPKRAGPERAKDGVFINARDLLPDDTGYYPYMGSLTTPPCSEGVNWYVLKARIPVGTEQARRFAEAVGDNARSLQALNHRLLLQPAVN